MPDTGAPVAVPPSGRKFPCPSCGARLDFDPAIRNLKCPYCGFERKIERGRAAEILERDYEDYLDREEAGGRAIPGRASETRCPGCGAVVLLEDKVETERCPYCTTHLENNPVAAKAMIPPESLLPFQIELRAAREAFTTWLSGLWFAPTELKKLATLGELNGVYVPYWTYDAMTDTEYDGQRGEHYTMTESYTDSNGNSRTRSVTYTRWHPASGEVRRFFDDVLVCASTSLPESLVSAQRDWPLPKLEPFRPDFLSGFRAERYAVGLKAGLRRAKEIMEPEIDVLIRHDIGGDEQIVDRKRTRYTAITFKPLLLPMWVAAYRYRDKPYQILVNGVTGRVSGDRPWSAWKIALLVLAILAVLIGMIVLYAKFGN